MQGIVSCSCRLCVVRYRALSNSLLSFPRSPAPCSQSTGSRGGIPPWGKCSFPPSNLHLSRRVLRFWGLGGSFDTPLVGGEASVLDHFGHKRVPKQCKHGCSLTPKRYAPLCWYRAFLLACFRADEGPRPVKRYGSGTNVGTGIGR